LKKATLRPYVWGICFLLLILDAKTALAGAAEGTDLCLHALIPSLFPFFVLSILLTSSLAGQKIRLLAPLTGVLGMQPGTEALLLIGLLGGYPVGAQTVAQAYEAGTLSKQEAERMLGFCNNAGPAFLFGIVSGKFASVSATWVLWGIHILSALITAMLLPRAMIGRETLIERKKVTVNQALQRAIRVMATVCGWVVLFRVMIAFCSKWLYPFLPVAMQVLLTGSLEMANGCLALGAIMPAGVRFVVAAAILSAGGLCVAMQTLSVTGKLGSGMYFPGKVLQTAISIVLASVFQRFLFSREQTMENVLIPIIISAFLAAATLLWLKKTVAFPKKMLYNHKNGTQEANLCSFASESKRTAATASTARH